MTNRYGDYTLPPDLVLPGTPPLQVAVAYWGCPARRGRTRIMN